LTPFVVDILELLLGMYGVGQPMYLETLIYADKARMNADNYGEEQQTEAM
jgi:hypothetical protein